MTHSFLTATGAPAPAHVAVFGARAPSLLLPTERFIIQFRDGRYRTEDPDEITFLCGVVRDESRSNRGVWIEQLPAVAPVENDAPVEPAKPSKRKRGA